MPYSIMSAKFGLLDPYEEIEPYDVTLKGSSRKFREELASKVIHQLRCCRVPKGATLIFLAGTDYFNPLAKSLDTTEFTYYLPMSKLSLGFRVGFLRHALRIDDRMRAVTAYYSMFEILAEKTGLQTLADAINSALPEQGVYFF